MKKKNCRTEKVRTNTILWDISMFSGPCEKPGKIWVFFLYSIKENIFHPWKNRGFPFLLLCSLSISCLFLWPQLIFRSLGRTELYAQILPLLAIAHRLVGWVWSCHRLRLCWSVKRSIGEEKQHNQSDAFPGLFPSVLSPKLINPKPWWFSF